MSTYCFLCLRFLPATPVPRPKDQKQKADTGYTLSVCLNVIKEGLNRSPECRT